jgi:hypothetical protein
MPAERFDDDLRSIPATQEPVRETTNRTLADQAEKTADPDDYPKLFRQPSHLATIHAVTNELQGPQRVSRGFTATGADLGPNLFDRRGISTACAELLDEN